MLVATRTATLIPKVIVAITMVNLDTTTAATIEMIITN